MAEVGSRSANSADRVAAQLREMMVTGHLTPGEQIRQVNMAHDLGVSRAPLREALKQLSSEGLVTHLHNSGYVVTRMSRDQFDQIYLMRRLLEREVLLDLPRLGREELDALTAHHEAVIAAADGMDLHAMQRHNHAFHFAMFAHSSLDFVVGELERLWRWAAPYHTVYLVDAISRDECVRDHGAMLDALEAFDNERLADLMDHHRLNGEEHLALRLRAAEQRMPSGV